MQLSIQNQVLQLQEVEITSDLVLEPRHVGDIELNSEPELGVPGSRDTVLVQLLP